MSRLFIHGRDQEVGRQICQLSEVVNKMNVDNLPHDDQTPTGSDFTIRLPFSIPPGHDLTDIPCCAEIAGHDCQLKKHGGFFVLEVRGFNTEDAAKAFLSKLGTGLLWAAVKRGVALTFNLNIRSVTYAQDPEQARQNLSRTLNLHIDKPVDGLGDASDTATYPSQKYIRWVSLGTPTVVVSSDPRQFLAAVSDGTALPDAELIPKDEKLRLAIDLYCLSQYEASQNARFLALVTSLEVLLPTKERPALIVGAIDQWIAQAKALMTEPKIEPDICRSLQALITGLDNLKSESITSRIREFIQDLLSAAGHEDAMKLAKKAADLYSKRSRLVHTGQADIGNGVSALEGIVRKILEAKMTSFHHMAE